MITDKISSEKIIIDLERFIISTGNIPKVIDIRKGRVKLDTAEYTALYGNCYTVISTVIEKNVNQLYIKNICDKWITNRNSILNGTKALIEVLDRNPKQEEYIKYARDNKYYQKVNWIFDDFNTVLQEITDTSEFYTVKFIETDVIQNITLLAKKIGRTPGFREYLEYAKMHNLCTNVKYYNTWNYFIKKAKLDGYNKKFSKKEIMELFIKLKNKLGRVPLKEQFSKEQGYPTAFLIDKYFGSYNNLLSLMKLEKNHRGKYETEELKNYFDAYIEKYGKIPTKYTFNLENGPNSSVYEKKFGCWGNTVKFFTGEEHFKSNQFAYPYKSNHGDVRPSYNEGVIDDLIGQAKIAHKHDFKYKDIVMCDHNYTMDFKFENNYIIEVAGLISENDFKNGGIGLKEECKKEYLERMKNKISLLEFTKYNLIIIFKRESYKSVIRKLSKVTSGFNFIRTTGKGKIMDTNIRKLPGIMCKITKK